MKSKTAASRKAPAKKKASSSTATAKKTSPKKSAARSRSAEKPKKSPEKAKATTTKTKAVKTKDRLKEKTLKPKAEVQKKAAAKASSARDKGKAKAAPKPSAAAKVKAKTPAKQAVSSKVKPKAKPSAKPVAKVKAKAAPKKAEAKKVETKAKVSAPAEKVKPSAKVKAKAAPAAKPVLKAPVKSAEKRLEKGKAEAPAPALKSKLKAKAPAEAKSIAIKAKAPAEAKSVAVKAKAPAEAKGIAIKAKAPAEAKGIAIKAKAPAEAKGIAVKAKAPAEAKGIAVKTKGAPPPAAPSKPAPEKEKEKAKIESKAASIAKEKERPKPAPAEAKEAPRTKLRPAIETKAAPAQKGTVSIKDGNVRILFPRWFRGPLEGMIASYLAPDFTDNGPHSLAVTLGQAFADLVADRLGAETLDRVAALLGQPSSENSQFVKRLSRSLERGFEERDEGTLLEEVDEPWLVKTFLNALGISFSPRKYVALRLLTRPLFEKGIADVLLEVRGSTMSPRNVAQRIVDAVNAVARRCGLGEMETRIAELRQREPRLEVVLASRLDGLRLGSAPPSQWRELGFPDVAARGKDERENVGSSSPIWIAREREASMVLDRLADIADLSWVADGGGGDVHNDEARLAEAGLVKTYRLDGVFAKGDTLRHATFGLGVVTVATRETIEVAFPGGMKKLAHGRTLP